MVRNIDEVDERPRRPPLPERGAEFAAPARPIDDVPGMPSFDVTRTDRLNVVVPAPRNGTGRHALIVPMPEPPPEPVQARRLLGRVRAWMIVMPVDGAILLGPLTWTPGQPKATVAMAGLSILLLGGGHYRARLHLSVLDELPSLVARMLAAAAAVATVIALRHDQDAVTTFLTNAVISLGLVIVGRLITNQITALSRVRRWTVHRTVLVGVGRWPPSWPRSSTGTPATASCPSDSWTTAATAWPRT